MSPRIASTLAAVSFAALVFAGIRWGATAPSAAVQTAPSTGRTPSASPGWRETAA